MKKLLFLFAAILLTATVINAQSSDPELAYIKKAYSKEKKTIVSQYMNLDVKQAGAFWPVYASYEAGREKLAGERVKLIEEYANNLTKLTAESADKIANAALQNTISRDKLNLEYYGKMKSAIGAVNAAKFMQLETYLQTTWQSFVQDNIPFIGQLDKTNKD